MLSRFSVKHPYLIVVTVIICLILGGVSLAKMKTDLMPDMDVPYLAVIATDPGASAEKVETEVTDVLESALSTVNGVASISSQSANNYAMVFLEFEDGTDMDSAMVKVSSAVNQVESTLPEAVGTPNIMEISLDMMATMYVAAADGEKSIYELSDFAADTLVPRLERVDGVADVSLAGAVQQTAEVRLSDDKIEDVNNRILASVNGELADAKREIDDGEADLEAAEEEITAQQEALADKEQETSDQLGQAASGLTLAVSSATTKVSSLGAQLQTLAAEGESLQGELADKQARAEELQKSIEELKAEAGELQAQMESATSLEEAATIALKLKDTTDALEAAASELTDVEYTTPDYHFDQGVYDKRVYNGWGHPEPDYELKFGPNIKDWPEQPALSDDLLVKIVSYITDPVTTTDELIPSGETSSFRSNPLRLAEFTLSRKDPAYVPNAKAVKALDNERLAGEVPDEITVVYAQVKALGYHPDAAHTNIGSAIFANKPGDGSAREQAASCQRVLGGAANFACEYATKRYRSNCINWGMLPFLLDTPNVLDNGDYVYLPGIRKALLEAADEMTAIAVKPDGGLVEFRVRLGAMTDAERQILADGCLINYYKNH